ncbi:hypothetical protein HK405_004875, partial [Cladochytrium tenue]
RGAPPPGGDPRLASVPRLSPEKLVIGSPVMALFNDLWYLAHVIKVEEAGQVRIHYDGHDTTVRASELLGLKPTGCDAVTKFLTVDGSFCGDCITAEELRKLLTTGTATVEQVE